MSASRQRVCLVTGATHGIGRATAAALAEQGAHVIVHGRRAELVDAACREIERTSPTATVSGIVADFASLAAVRTMAQAVLARHERLDVLVNNAGTIRRHRELTADGYERQFAVNHLAPFALTLALLPLLEASAPARIVTVASRAHGRVATLDLDDPGFAGKRYDQLGAYGASKLANILFSNELARRLDASRVTSNALHPGVVATNLFANLGAVGTVFGTLARPWLRTAERGAATSVYLASAPEVAGVTGGYFVDCREARPSPAAEDRSLARGLWALSERLVAAAG
jgi:NAD(P)-dependent dehydrogenase (short-subunit alcohol dehydrogenase family)